MKGGKFVGSRYVLAIDQGTTGTKALLVDEEGEVVSGAYREHRQIYPFPGWVEHDLEEIWQKILEVTGECLAGAGVRAKQIASVGLSNQGETVAAWSRKTGKVLHNAIVWQCRRTARRAEELAQNEKLNELIRRRTGLVVDCYFSATKLEWLLQNVAPVQEAYRQGDLVLGTLDSWMIFRMSGGKELVTDPSTASRTMLFNIHELQWDQEIVGFFNFDLELLPPVKNTIGYLGHTDPDSFLGIEAPICGSAVDQQAALFGQACLSPGQMKNTYGTGCFMLLNTGSKAVLSGNGLLTTVAWSRDGKATYALDGGVYTAGSAIQWLRDGLGIISSPQETEAMALAVEDNGGVYFVPAFSGLAAPHWDMWARGTILGLTGYSRKEHVVRATLEAIAYQVRDVAECMAKDLGQPLSVLRVDGGPTKNNFLMQFQSDILGIPVEVAGVTDITAMGAAYMALIGAGLWEDTTCVAGKWKARRVYEPSMPADQREKLFHDWHKAVERARNWEREVRNNGCQRV
ncbi:MAG: glycerol kinase GlpK [Moorellaceae bacterium]